MRKCTKCKKEKSINEFNFRKSTNRYQAECKECEKERNKKYKLKNKKNLDKKNQNYRENNKEAIKERNKDYRDKNKDIIKENNKIYREANKIVRNKKQKERRENDLFFKFRDNISKLICKSFKQHNQTKNSKTTKILGCSILEFKNYIESQFEPWMTWENHGVYIKNKEQTWQLDHIIPISSAKTEEDVIRLNHFTNLRPLDSLSNLIKSNRY